MNLQNCKSGISSSVMFSVFHEIDGSMERNFRLTSIQGQNSTRWQQKMSVLNMKTHAALGPKGLIIQAKCHSGLCDAIISPSKIAVLVILASRDIHISQHPRTALRPQCSLSSRTLHSCI